MATAPRPSQARETSRRVPIPPERRLVLDTLRLGRHKPMMHGLLEVDVTRARELIRDHRERTAEAFSFTSFVLCCLGRAIAAHPEVHALRDWFGGLVIFDDVDATTIVEVEIDGGRFPLAHVVRAIDRRTAREIHEEIRAVQAGGMGTLSPGLRRVSRVFLSLPGFLRRTTFRLLLRSPRFAKRQTGTVLVTAVGMFGTGAGWGLSAPGIHGLSVVIGGIVARAAPGNPRELLCLTVSADHERVDGAPLARFVRDLQRRLEAAEDLEASLAAFRSDRPAKRGEG